MLCFREITCPLASSSRTGKYGVSGGRGSLFCMLHLILLLGVLMLGCMNNIHIRILPLFSLSLSLSLSPSPKKSDCMLKPGSLAQDITMCMCLDQTKLSTKLN